MNNIATAQRFLQVFPEATLFSFNVLRAVDKKAITSRPQCSAAELYTSLSYWLSMPQVHVFLRPLMANLIMIDLDEFKGDMRSQKKKQYFIYHAMHIINWEKKTSIALNLVLQLKILVHA